MKIARLALLLLVVSSGALAQEENVPVANPVYDFLKRMEVKHLIERYFDVVLPLSRGEVAKYLLEAEVHMDKLSRAERTSLLYYLREFQYDISRSTEGFHRLIDPDSTGAGEGVSAVLADREKFLYFLADSTVTLFMNGLIDVDSRRIHGDALGKGHTEYLQAGGRVRGTVFGHLGYYAQWTNAQFWGSKELLDRDPIISQSHALQVGNIQNFDFAESYLRYGTSVVSAQVGRERVLWGTGYDEKMTFSDNVRQFDFLRFDAKYKALKYTFLHGWLVGKQGLVVFSVPADTAARFAENVADDKYVVAHRLDLSFPGVVDIGLQEMLIYSNRSPDIAYLNPLTIIESTQRSRGERDNTYWALDMQWHFIPGIELSGSITYDDINVPDLFTSVWSDRYGWQAGMFYADMFGIENTALMVEYTRIEPFVYSHARSRDGSYTNLDRILGPRIGPNADSWFFRTDFLPARNLTFSFRVNIDRKGTNIVDANGVLVRNVGSDPFLPHRDSDPRNKKWMDGLVVRTRAIDLRASWEIFHQLWLDGRFLLESLEHTDTGARSENGTFFVHLRTEF
jgi:hypothetical protein